MPFGVAGAPDAARLFELEIELDRPKAVQIRWEMPAGFVKALGPANAKLLKIKAGAKQAVGELPQERLVRLPGVRLTKSAHHSCSFLVQGNSQLLQRPARLAIKQLFDRVEVGRVTWELRGKRVVARAGRP